MKITRRQSIKTIASLVGAPFLLGKEAVAQDKFQFSEELKGFIAVDETDGWHKTRAIYDFERGFKTGGERGKSEIGFMGSMKIDDLDAFERDPRKAARFEGEVTYNAETVPIDRGKVKLFTSDPAYEKEVRYLVYYLPFSTGGRQYVLSGYKQVRLKLDLAHINVAKNNFLTDMTTLYTHLHQGSFEGSLDSPRLGPMLGAGILNFDIKDVFALVASCKPSFPSLAPLKFFKIIAGEAIEDIIGL